MSQQSSGVNINWAKVVAHGGTIPSEESVETLQEAFERIKKTMTMEMLEELRDAMVFSLDTLNVTSIKRPVCTYTPHELWQLFINRHKLSVKIKKLLDHIFSCRYSEWLFEYDDLRDIRDEMYNHLVSHRVKLIPEERRTYSAKELWGIAIECATKYPEIKI